MFIWVWLGPCHWNKGKYLWSKQPFNNLDLFLPSLIYQFAQLAILNEEFLGFNSILAVWMWNSIRNSPGPRFTVVAALADSPLKSWLVLFRAFRVVLSPFQKKHTHLSEVMVSCWHKFSPRLWISASNPSQTSLIPFLDQSSWEGSLLSDQVYNWIQSHAA